MVRKITWTLILLLLFGIILYLMLNPDKKDDRTMGQIIEHIHHEYDTMDFSNYYNLEISIRERGNIRDAVILSTVSYREGELPMNITIPSLEWIIFNYGGILTIKDCGFSNDKDCEYMSETEIKALVKKFYKLDLDYLKVDYKYNVYLSPSPLSFERVFMLRVNDSTIVSRNNHLSIERVGAFTHYRGHWYLSDFYIDKYDIKIN